MVKKNTTEIWPEPEQAQTRKFSHKYLSGNLKANDQHLNNQCQQ